MQTVANVAFSADNAIYSAMDNLLIENKSPTSLPLPSANTSVGSFSASRRNENHHLDDHTVQHALHPTCSTVDIAVNDQQPPSADVADLMRLHCKHVFILSDAGKPVYTRYGSEEDMAAYMGIIQALVSFVSNCAGCDDQLTSMQVGRHQFVFCHFSPLILCMVSSQSVTVAQLQNQLHCLYRYIVSVLTANQLKRIFDERKNFDLRRLLTGTDRTLDRLLDSAETDYCLMLNAVPSLALNNSLKETIVQTIVSQCCQSKAVIYAVLLVNDQLVATSCRKGHSLAWFDLHLLINLVASNPSFRNAESWSPVCLSGYDENLFLSAHISYLADNSPACLLLLTDNRGAFFQLSAVRAAIIQKLTKAKIIGALGELAEPWSVATNDLAVQDLIHFVYKLNSKNLYTSMAMLPAYSKPAFRDYLFNRYLRLHGYVRQNRQLAANSRYVYYATGSLDTMLAWATQSFELYAAFNPLVTKAEAIGRVDQLMRWIKKEEANLFAITQAVH